MNEQVLERLFNLEGVKPIRRGSRSTIWRDVKAGTFPEPFYINGKAYWKESQLVEWQSNLQTFEERQAENIDPMTNKMRAGSDDLQAKVEVRADAKAEMRAKRRDSEETAEAESTEEAA